MESLILIAAITLPITVASFIFFALSKTVCLFLDQTRKTVAFFCKNTVYIVVVILFSLSILSNYDRSEKNDINLNQTPIEKGKR